eukprot:844546-Amphidinium_carterae.1
MASGERLREVHQRAFHRRPALALVGTFAGACSSRYTQHIVLRCDLLPGPPYGPSRATNTNPRSFGFVLGFLLVFRTQMRVVRLVDNVT